MTRVDEALLLPPEGEPRREGEGGGLGETTGMHVPAYMRECKMEMYREASLLNLLHVCVSNQPSLFSHLSLFYIRFKWHCYAHTNKQTDGEEESKWEDNQARRESEVELRNVPRSGDGEEGTDGGREGER